MTCPFLELDKFTLCCPTLNFFKIHHNTIFPSIHRSSKWFLSYKCLGQKTICISTLLHMCNMMLPSHPPWLYYPNNIWLVVQVMKILTMQSPHNRHYLASLRPQYLPQHTILVHPQPMAYCLTWVPNLIFLTLLCMGSIYI
jgi:hypothetical protein